MSLLKDRCLRDIMYGSVAGWIEYLRNTLGMTIEDDDKLVEMFLMRNAIVHNNSRVSQDLVAFGSARFKTAGKELNVTEKDLDRYLKSVQKAAEQI